MSPWTGGISWHRNPDPERPGESLWTGYPGGLTKVHFLMQKDDAVYWWLLQSDDGKPLQTRVGYKTPEAAMRGAALWLEANPDG